jgi:hypothetical protein
MVVEWRRVLEDTIEFLKALPDELGDLTENIQRDRPDLYERRLDLMTLNSRNLAIALLVILKSCEGEDVAIR